MQESIVRSKTANFGSFTIGSFDSGSSIRPRRRRLRRTHSDEIRTHPQAFSPQIICRSFVCFATKAVHLELVSDLTTASFMATLRRFIARRGKPSTIWSDHGTNFVGAARELKELEAFLRQQGKQRELSDFCAASNIRWTFTPEHAPHFGGLWEAAVKSFKKHMRVVVGEAKLTFEEMTTVLTQIEACLNSRPLTPLPEASDSIEALTPGHFLIGRPLEAIPERSPMSRSVSLVRRWHLCQKIVQHFWQRWSKEYLCQLQRFAKWNIPSPNLKVGDIICLRGEQVAPMKWTLERVKELHSGPDGKVWVVTVQTPKRTYKQPVMKVVPLVTSNKAK